MSKSTSDSIPSFPPTAPATFPLNTIANHNSEGCPFLTPTPDFNIASYNCFTPPVNCTWPVCNGSAGDCE